MLPLIRLHGGVIGGTAISPTATGGTAIGPSVIAGIGLLAITTAVRDTTIVDRIGTIAATAGENDRAGNSWRS
jgi:hypothetical protein